MSARPVIPRSLTIAGCPWQVVTAHVPGAYGQSDDVHKTITLDPVASATPFGEADTLLHEVMHSTLRQQGRVSCEEEETYVRALATGLCGVFRDNPALLRYLTKALA